MTVSPPGLLSCVVSGRRLLLGFRSELSSLEIQPEELQLTVVFTVKGIREPSTNNRYSDNNGEQPSDAHAQRLTPLPKPTPASIQERTDGNKQR